MKDPPLLPPIKAADQDLPDLHSECSKHLHSVNSCLEEQDNENKAQGSEDLYSKRWGKHPQRRATAGVLTFIITPIIGNCRTFPGTGGGQRSTSLQTERKIQQFL